MRVLHYIDEVLLEKGGVVRAVLDLTAELAKAGAEVTLLTGDATDAPEAWHNPGKGMPLVLTVERKVSPLTLILPPETREGSPLRQQIDSHDVVHLHIPWDPFLPTIAKAARQANKPYLVSTHGMLDDWSMAEKHLKKRLYLAAVGRGLLERATFVHYTAEGERDQASQWAPQSNPLVAPLLMDLSPFVKPFSAGPAEEAFPALGATQEPRLLFLSRVDKKKGIDLLIEAVAWLKDQGNPVRAFVAGPGEEAYQESLVSLARARGVDDRVHFLGMVRGDLKWSLYHACDLFVLPTHQENFGIVLVEAMGCGLPTLTTTKTDIWQELQRHGATIVDDQAEPVATALKALLDNREATAEAGRRGRTGVLEWLDPQRVSQQYLDAYEAAIADHVTK